MKNIVLFILLLLGMKLNAQLSQGGYPMEISNLKSKVFTEQKALILPSFDLSKDLQETLADSLLKTFKFAHSFKVSFTPQNSGVWVDVGSYRVWQLRVKSDSAKSLSLIFTKYYLPEGARLFVYNPTKEVVLGAFTARNNKVFKKLAIYPVPGDELVIQYEEPINATFRAELEIGKINHDYIGIVPLKNRWVRRTSGECNVDINCSTSGFDKQQRAVCRILADDELGTATLINNTAEDGKPYVISAFHVFDSTGTAEITLFDFNYESPCCSGIDGYDSQSISGATAIAAYNKLDFILVELSEMPPPSFRPYLAGWDVNHIPPSNSYAIHHPNGDTKKISHDEGICDSLTYSTDYFTFGHWKVGNWESGTTEGGSSGCALFTDEGRVVGTLTGGFASCTNLSYDAFARLDKMWDTSNLDKQKLKPWLDPNNLGVKILDGYDPYLKTTVACRVISNYLMEDRLTNVSNTIAQVGTIAEVAERYDQVEQGVLTGVAIGIDAYVAASNKAQITISVYDGIDYPDKLMEQYHFDMNRLTRKAMNYLSFDDDFQVAGTFFIGVEVGSYGDSVFLYQSNFRQLASGNTMLVNDNGQWKYVSEYSAQGLGASLLIQPTLCSASFTEKEDTLNGENELMKVYPIPADHFITVEFCEPRQLNELVVYDMVGQLMYKGSFQSRNYADIDVSQFLPGIYLVHLISDGQTETRRIAVN